jgi:hypothetical protein
MLPEVGRNLFLSGKFVFLQETTPAAICQDSPAARKTGKPPYALADLRWTLADPSFKEKKFPDS